MLLPFKNYVKDAPKKVLLEKLQIKTNVVAGVPTESMLRYYHLVRIIINVLNVKLIIKHIAKTCSINK